MYGGEAEGIKAVPRKQLFAGSNPLGQSPMDMGIGQGLQMKRNPKSIYSDKTPIGGGFSFMGGARVPTTSEMNVPAYDEMPPSTDTLEAETETGLGATKKGFMEKFILGERFTDPNYESPMKFRPGTGFGFMDPGTKVQLAIDAEKAKRESADVEKGLGEVTMEEISAKTPLGDFPTDSATREDLVKSGIISEDEKKLLDKGDTLKKPTGDDIDLAGKDDADNIDRQVYNATKDKNPKEILGGEEQYNKALMGGAMPDYDAIYGPMEAELKRDTWLNVAKLGLNLMRKPVAEAGIEALEDVKGTLKEQRALKRLVALKKAEAGKDIYIAQLKATLSKPSRREEVVAGFRNYISSVDPSLPPPEIDRRANLIAAKYSTSGTKGLADEERSLSNQLIMTDYVDVSAVPPEQRSFYDALGKTGVLSGGVISTSNLQKLDTETTGKDDKRKPIVDKDMVMRPGYFYYEPESQFLFRYTGNKNMSYGEAAKNQMFDSVRLYR